MSIDPKHLARFKADLATLPTDEIYRRYVLPEVCNGLTEVDQLSLRKKIADKFEVDVAEVIIVGSAKLGFTLMPKRSGRRPAFSIFSENSDIDIAIISDVLFDQVWKQCFEFWHSSGYADSITYWGEAQSFRNYIFRGWLRPDKLPAEGKYRYKKEWFDFFKVQLPNERVAGDYKVSAGLYRDAYFLEAYQKISINKCKAGLITQ